MWSLVMCTYTVKTKLCISNFDMFVKVVKDLTHALIWYAVAMLLLFVQGEYTVLPLLYLLCIWWNKAVEKREKSQAVGILSKYQKTVFSKCRWHFFKLSKIHKWMKLGEIMYNVFYSKGKTAKGRALRTDLHTDGLLYRYNWYHASFNYICLR